MAVKDKLKSLKNRASGIILANSNIFTKYFLLFAAIFIIVFIVLGSSLFIIVNNYTANERTKLLKNNTASVSNTVENVIDIDDMNKSYSIEKELLCETLSTISQSIEADIFVCDLDGNIIFCGERAGSLPFSKNMLACSKHDNLKMSSNIIDSVSKYGEVVETTHILSLQYFVVGKPILSDGKMIGAVFSLANTGVQTLVLEFLRIFLVSAFFCLILAFVCIYYLTKRMITPLHQMSSAAKQFAVGDFSYRVKTTGNDELADLGRAFNDMADALDALEGSRRSFVSNVSHELKTPMTSIAGFIDGILDGTIPQNKQQYYLEIVSAEVRRLSRLVISMLNMSKIESGDLEIKPSNYDISDQIIHILLTFEQKIENKNIEIRGLDNLKPTYIVADPDMIYQAIYNLFDNAVKFTNEDGYIEVSLVERSSDIEVSIKNSGEGIRQEELSKVFERFYKVDKSRSLDSKGAGLGLYIVKLMIEMHGGRVLAKSDSTETAEFTFNLPKQFSPIYKKEKK
ncbi:MAG: HAMP domain-containing histidine kinase [Clostridiales bacterium]|nr:HAMP domain-containing histidine kinase [Clostridiales bacterium]